MLSPAASAVMATLPVVRIVNISPLEAAKREVPLAITVLNARFACALALAKAAVAIVVSIVAFAADLSLPLLSTVNTGTIVELPYVVYVTPVSVRSKVIFFVEVLATIETFALAMIVRVSLFDAAIMLEPFAITVPKVIWAALLALVYAAFA